MGILLTRVGVVALGALGALAVLLAGAAPPPTPALLATGKAGYEMHCAACHGVAGDGKGPVAFAVKPPPRDLVREPFKAGDSVDQIYKTITSGLPNTRMVGYPQIDEVERWAVAYYVRAFRIKK